MLSSPMLSASLKRAVRLASRGAEGLLRPRQPLSSLTNFLLLQNHRALGAAVNATPLIRTLHAVIPQCRVAVAAGGFSYQLLAHHPALERLVESPDPREDFRGSLRALRRARFFAGEPYAVLQTIGTADP